MHTYIHAYIHAYIHTDIHTCVDTWLRSHIQGLIAITAMTTMPADVAHDHQWGVEGQLVPSRERER